MTRKSDEHPPMTYVGEKKSKHFTPSLYKMFECDSDTMEIVFPKHEETRTTQKTSPPRDLLGRGW